MNDPMRRILLATDGWAGGELAARTAIRLADSTGCELHLVYVEKLPSGPERAPIGARHLEGELQERVEREGLVRLLELEVGLRSAGGVVAGAHLRIGDVAREVFDSIVRHAPCPVVVAGPQESGDRGSRSRGSWPPSWGTREPRRQ